MMRFRIALLAAAATLSLGAIAVPAASAARSSAGASGANTRTLLSVPVTGAATSGNKQFRGVLRIQRYVAGGQHAYAVGTLKGTLGNERVTRNNVRFPVTLAQPSSSSASAHAAATCPVLTLQLAPIHLNLLGLHVDLGGGANQNQPIVLTIVAHSGEGLLGDLLCGVSNALSQNGLLAQLNNSIQSLVAALNGLTAMLP